MLSGTVTTTLLTKSGTCLIRLFASLTERFLGDDSTSTTNPTAPAPALTAVYKSFLLVIPQILILVILKLQKQTP